MKLNRKTVGIVLAVVAVAGVAAYFMLHGGKSQVQVNFETAKVEKATIGSSITATGTIEAVTTVEVGTQVSGIIDKIYVDYNSPVKRGQVIAELDKTNLVSELNSANSNLQGARSDLNYQQANYNRQRTLFEKGLISANDFESARLSYRQAEEQVAMIKESVVAAQESVRTAQTNLGYATIVSPIDGTIINKYVAEGQTVAASFSTPELFGVARDLKKMQVLADVDEADIGDVRPGESTTFTVDAYPDDQFQGAGQQVRLGGSTSNNVVTYKVVISTSNADLKLKPGMTANVTICTQQKSGVLSVPTKALRFTPAKETVGKMKIKDISNAKNKVWTIEGNNIVPHQVNIGMSDGTHTQIVSGIKQGQKVITGVDVKTDDAAADGSNSSESSPFAPGPRKNNKKK